MYEKRKRAKPALPKRAPKRKTKPVEPVGALATQVLECSANITVISDSDASDASAVEQDDQMLLSLAGRFYMLYA